MKTPTTDQIFKHAYDQAMPEHGEGWDQFAEILKRKMAEMEDCLREAIDLMEDTRNGAYKPDSVTTQPWVRCLADD